MAKDQIIVGLEIGTTKICAVVAEARRDGSLKLLGVGQAPSRGVRKGEIVDFDTAQKCVHEALVDAEEKSDTEIKSVFLAVTGGHIQSFNNRGSINIPEEQEEIEEKDCEMVRASASDVSLPPQNTFLSQTLQHYYVDGQDGVLNPVGMMGGRLEADYHIIHGIGTRIKNSIRCVREIPLDIEDVVFSPLAAAQVVLTQNQKDLGALVIDMGGGTTDYIVYVDGVIKQSGVLPLGGDHITNDISMGLRLPTARAERLKIEEGSVVLGQSLPGETVSLKDDSGFAGKDVERETLNAIIHMRVREILELLKRRLDEADYLDFLGAGALLTGGCSQLRGIEELAVEVLGIPVHLTRAQTMAGITSAFENPQFSTAIGLVKYGQAANIDRPRGLFAKIRRTLPWFLNLW